MYNRLKQQADHDSKGMKHSQTKYRLPAAPPGAFCCDAHRRGGTCPHATRLDRMTTLQVSNLSPQTYEELQARATKAGMSLSDYVAQELTCLAATSAWDDGLPTWDEYSARIAAYGPVDLGPNGNDIVVDLIRASRGPLP